MRTRGLAEGTFSYTWSFPICPHRVGIGLPIIEALQQELAGGGEPRQGLLFGQSVAGITQIDEWRTLPSLDRDVFETTLPIDARNAVGYYCIREGSSFVLSPAEVALAQEFFRKPGAVVLLIERRRKGPAEASFFFWRGDVFVHNLPLPFPFHAGILSGETPGLADVPKAPPARMPAPTRAQRRALRLGLYCATAMAAGGLLAAIFHDRREMPMVPLPGQPQTGQPASAAVWIPTQPKRDLELTWNPQTEAVLAATAGVLKIEDAGVTRQMSLDVGELLLGSILYAPASERIRVELTTLQRDGRMAPVTVAAQLAVPAYSTPVAASPVLPTKGDLASGNDRGIEPPPKKQEADRRPPLKRFDMTGADRPAAAPSAIPEVPQESLPPVSPAVLTATLPPSLLAPTPPPAPPKAAPAPARPAMPRAGRVIWTGSLARQGIVELDGRSASVGSLNGALPGAPVSLSITPAEFGPDGLMVYTTDASRHNRMEPASAGTGWNRVTYVWDPERVRQISVLEAPNPNNGFNRLALRNDARRCSMILIDWTLR